MNTRNCNKFLSSFIAALLLSGLVLSGCSGGEGQLSISLDGGDGGGSSAGGTRLSNNTLMILLVVVLLVVAVVGILR